MGIGRTNIIACGSSGGVTTVDLPTCPEAISVQAGNKCAVLSLTYSNTENVSGVEVRYKTGDYPENPFDGNGLTVSGTETSISISGLANSITHYIRVFLYREIDGVKYYQTDPTNAKISVFPTAVVVTGITPAIVGENYMVIDQSGSFTLVGGDLTVYMVGGGANGGSGYTTSDTDTDEGWEVDGGGGIGGRGGSVKSFELNALEELSCVSSIGAAADYGGTNETTLQADSTKYTTKGEPYKLGGQGSRSYCEYTRKYGHYNHYSCHEGSTGQNGVLTPYGYIGSSGGGGGSLNHNSANGGTGAGNGSSYKGNPATNYGCGGGGGGGDYDPYDGGAGKQGCIILVWRESEGT